jgi:hypothetical protein
MARGFTFEVAPWLYLGRPYSDTTRSGFQGKGGKQKTQEGLKKYPVGRRDEDPAVQGSPAWPAATHLNKGPPRALSNSFEA